MLGQWEEVWMCEMGEIKAFRSVRKWPCSQDFSSNLLIAGLAKNMDYFQTFTSFPQLPIIVNELETFSSWVLFPANFHSVRTIIGIAWSLLSWEELTDSLGVAVGNTGTKPHSQDVGSRSKLAPKQLISHPTGSYSSSVDFTSIPQGCWEC